MIPSIFPPKLYTPRILRLRLVLFHPSIACARSTPPAMEHIVMIPGASDGSRLASRSLLPHVWGTVDMEDVEVMVRDGQRLGWLENECQNGYVGSIVALDWRRLSQIVLTKFSWLPNCWLSKSSSQQQSRCTSEHWRGMREH